MGKLLPTVEAFRMILRTTHPEREDLQQIGSRQWFHDRKTVRLERQIYHDQADEPAYAAHDLLKAGVKSQKIRLRGCLNGAEPNDIDPIDVREGELDVFACTLKIYASKNSLRTTRIFEGVHCYKDDIQDLLQRSDDHIAPKEKYLTNNTVEAFVQDYIASAANPTDAGLCNYAKEKNIVGRRDLYRTEYRRQMKPRLGGEVRPGRRNKIREN